ncbi:MAG: preprotein translocase subunit Sec61beta [Acidilobaceae archaeon]
MSAAGLISFYEEFEGRFRLSPLAVLLLAIAVIAIVGSLHIFF